MTTLLALYRRPEGGEDAVETFRRRYREEHLPLVAGTPGLRSTTVQETTAKLLGEDVILTHAHGVRRPGIARRRPRLGRDARRRQGPA